MAIYHLSIKVFSRGKGKSAVASAAYRSGEKIKNDYDGMTHDFTNKGGIVHTEILLPENAPSEYKNRSVLWNAVEQIEKNRNAQLAREIEVSLPRELSHEQHLQLVREYCEKYFVSAGMVADMCFHTQKPKEDDNENPHVHIMLTMRPFEQNGTWGAKSKKEYILDDNGQKILLPSGEFKTRKINTTDWNEQTKAEEWRQGWADVVNRFLEQNSVTQRVDHRSYERQGIDQKPTIHMGVAATQMERKGIATDRDNINREIAITNKEIKQLKARLRKLNSWLKEQTIPAKNNVNPIPSINLQAVVADILNSSEQKNRYGKIYDLKTAAKIFAFFQENNITALPQLGEKVSELSGRLIAVSEKFKPVDRRLKTLDKHIEMVETRKHHASIYKQYQQLKPKQQATFYDAHSAEITAYENADKYLKDHLNGRDKIPVATWQSEQKKLLAERTVLYREYGEIKAGIKECELVRRNVEQMVRDTQPERTATSLKKETEL